MIRLVIIAKRKIFGAAITVPVISMARLEIIALSGKILTFNAGIAVSAIPLAVLDDGAFQARY